MQALATRTTTNLTRDKDPQRSLELMADEFKAEHLKSMTAADAKRLEHYAGFVQLLSSRPHHMVLLFSLDGLDVVAAAMSQGLCTTWYIDATGDMVR
jgi:hypothetical protein